MRRTTASLISLTTLTLALGALPLAPASASTGYDRTFVRYTASNGARSNYHLYRSGVENAGMIVWLDGDGQWGHDHPWSSYALGGEQGLVAQGRARGLDVVSVRTPAKDDTWWSSCSRNQTYLHELLTYLRVRLGTDSQRIWLVGYSGGAQFTTQCYLPRRANTIANGGAVMFGGGGRPNISYPYFTDATRQNLELTWITGRDDTAVNSVEGYDALAYAMRGEEWYRNAGFTTTGIWPFGYDHDDAATWFGVHTGTAIDRAD